MNIGNVLLISSMLAFLATIILRRIDHIRVLFRFSCFLVIGSFLCLVYHFIISDFSIQNVFLNSSTIKPLMFKLAASWASHEGSMLLWLSLLSIISLIYYSLTLNNPHKTLILASINLLFCSFVYFTSNPFNVLSFKPKEGLGLNPMLQDIALIIHPPILYLGYVSYLVPFVNSCIMLIALQKNTKISSVDYISSNMDIFRLNNIFSNIGIVALTSGIALGSWWAYRELGWGGYWFFDPVENISLIPWLSAIALHHSLLATIKYNRLLVWSLALSIITFLLCIFGTFLVRSGQLVSIHSFASSPERAVYMLSIFALISLPSLYLLLGVDKIEVNKTPFINLTKGLVIGNILWMICLMILLLSTIYPILYSLHKGDSVTLTYEYFVDNFVPIIIPILSIIVFFSYKTNILQYVVNLLLSTLITFLASYNIHFGWISAIVFILSICLMIQVIYVCFNKIYLKQSLSNSFISMSLGHFSFGLLIFSINLNILTQSEVDFIGKIGDVSKFDQFEVGLKDIKFAEGVNYYRQIAEFWIRDSKHNSITILKPENRLYMIEQTLSQESDIYSYLTYDLYAVLNRIDGDTIHSKIYYRPMISFIWLSSILMIGAFLIRLS